MILARGRTRRARPCRGAGRRIFYSKILEDAGEHWKRNDGSRGGWLTGEGFAGFRNCDDSCNFPRAGKVYQLEAPVEEDCQKSHGEIS